MHLSILHTKVAPKEVWLRQLLLYQLRHSTSQYSATCAIQHLSFPTSCDIRKKIMVPKYICLLK